VHDEDSATQRGHRIAREATEREFRAEQVEYERCKVAESKQMFAEAEVFQLKQRNLAKRKSAAARSFIEAVEIAQNQIKSDGLEGEVRPWSEIRYTVAQGLKAAIHGREDIIATLLLQEDILVRLDAIKRLLWMAVGLLAFVAYKLA
jgi:hypothetical protein